MFPREMAIGAAGDMAGYKVARITALKPCARRNVTARR